MQWFLLAVLLAVSQALPPVPGKAANDSTGTGSHVQSQSKPEKTPPAPSPPLINAKEAPKHDASGNGQGNENADHSISVSKLPPVTVVARKRDWADWGYWVFSGLLVVVGGLQIWLLCGTLKAIRRQAAIMLRQTKATEDAVIAAKRSVEIVIDKERARIEVEMKGAPTIAGPNDALPMSEVGYIVRCYGTTPASILDTKSWAEINDSEQASSSQSYIAMFLPSRMMPTSEGIGQTASLSWDYQKLEVDDIAEKVSKRELFVHFYGRIKYRDMFGGNWAYTF
jgi:hypothetical protein